MGSPPTHTPDWHVSVCVHAFPSLHAAPLGLWVYTQPLRGEHVAVLQGSAAHVMPPPPWQTPLWHVSFCVQRSPSSQAVPLALLA